MGEIIDVNSSAFLALSATVGHPLRLKRWLNTISNVLQLELMNINIK